MKHWQTDFLDGRREGRLQIGGAKTPPILFLGTFMVVTGFCFGVKIKIWLVFTALAVNHNLAVENFIMPFDGFTDDGYFFKKRLIG